MAPLSTSFSPDELGRNDGVVPADKLDSVRDIVSSAGSVLDHVVYDSFGNVTTETNASNGDRFKFAGMEYDSTTQPRASTMLASIFKQPGVS